MSSEYGNRTYSRPSIQYICGEFTHNGDPCRVVLRRNTISIGCSDVTPDVLRKLLSLYDEKFGSDEVVVQP